MRLIHQPHNHIRLAFVLPRQLLPQSGKITRLGATSGPNGLAIPPRVIMNIDNTVRTCRQAGLHQGIVLSKISFVQGAAEDAVDEVLPADGEAEDVETVVLGKVGHLCGAVVTSKLVERWVDGGNRAGALGEEGSVRNKMVKEVNEKVLCTYIGSTAEIEASDIDTCEFDTSGDSPSCAESYNRASEKLRDGMHCRGINAAFK